MGELKNILEGCTAAAVKARVALRISRRKEKQMLSSGRDNANTEGGWWMQEVQFPAMT